MGEIADAMLDGDFCEGCGEYLGDGDGFPRRCAGCAGCGGYDDEDPPEFFPVSRRRIAKAVKRHRFRDPAPPRQDGTVTGRWRDILDFLRDGQERTHAQLHEAFGVNRNNRSARKRFNRDLRMMDSNGLVAIREPSADAWPLIKATPKGLDQLAQSAPDLDIPY